MALIKPPEQKELRKIFIDFETSFSTKTGYDLKKLSVLEYVRDPRFKAFGLGYAFETGAIEWVSGAQLETFFKTIPWKDLAVVAQNAKFDCFILREKYGVQAGQWIDTIGMARAVWGKRIKGYSLAELAAHYGLESKGTMKTDGLRELTADQEAELAEYCKTDVRLCRTIFGELAKDFPVSQYPLLHQTVQMFVNPRLVLDVPLLEKCAEQEKERKLKIFDEIGIDKKVFASNKQFPELLKKYGYDVPTKKSPRNEKQIPALALGDEGFRDMLESGDPMLRNLCEARVAAKSVLLETRSGALAAIGRTGAWSFDVRFSGATQTHRYSGGSGAGGNPQNFTRGSDLRKAVTAPAGMHLVVGDFAAVEARMVAFLAQEPTLMRVFSRGEDPYCNFGSAFFKRDITKKDVEERRFSKCAVLGLGYNMGPSKFQKAARLQTGQRISDEDAKAAVGLYRSMYSAIPALWKQLDAFIPFLTTGQSGQVLSLPVRFEKETLILPSGLKMFYPNLRRFEDEWVYDIWDKRQLVKRNLYGGKLLENMSQALAGELCKDVAGRFGDKVTGLVHDEVHLLTDDPADKEGLLRAMTASPAWFPQLKLAAEVGIGNNWLGAK